MPGSLDHGPAVIIQQLIVDLGLATLPGSSSWPIYAYTMPSTPDSLITVKDTQGLDNGRTSIDGELQGMQGFQVIVRAAHPQIGRKKANDIRIALSEGVDDISDVYWVEVEIGNATYLVETISRIGDVISAGTESPTSKRELFTLNGVVSVTQSP